MSTQYAKSIKDKIILVGKKIATPAIAAAVASGVTYFVCDNIHNEEVAVLHEQIAELKKNLLKLQKSSLEGDSKLKRKQEKQSKK